MSRKSRPNSALVSYLVGQDDKPVLAAPGVPNCPTCHTARQPVAQTDIPQTTWDELASLWELLVEQEQYPNLIAYCATCNQYGILGSWSKR